MGGASARISEHAIIGDGRSAALVTRAGSIDWLCWPRFDSDAVFAGLLDPEGGAFDVTPVGPFRAARRYLPETNVLETRFSAAGGTGVLLDFMPIGGGSDGDRPPAAEREILRILRCESGELEVEVVVDPRPGFGRARRRWRDARGLGLHLHAGNELFAFRSEPPLPLSPGGGVRARVRLPAGATARFSLTHAVEAPASIPPLGPRAEDALASTVDAWRSWAARIAYTGPFRAEVVRSALALKLLVHTPSGAIVAAPTTSLPERMGGALNWDYRYCWLRDASMTVRALFGLGFREEAEAFVGWLIHSTRLTRPSLRILYDVYGRSPPREREVGLAGYAGSRPVRKGNAAKDQVQLDVYGEVVDAAAQLVRRGVQLDRETRRMLTAFGEYVCRHWREADEGIWEPRTGARQHTYSKALCWVALDRLLELHRSGHLPRVRADRLACERAELRRAIERRGYSRVLGSYVQVFDGEAMDAALLQLPWYGYGRAGSPRMRSTLARIERELGAGGGLLYRYRASPEWREGAFGICAFWAAENVALGGGPAAEAESRIAALLRYANDVGLFAEEIDPVTGDALGNFPQAFTHIGLVNACLTLQNRLTGREQLAHQRDLPQADGAGVAA